MTATIRVPPGEYLKAAQMLTRERGAFDKYDLATRVGKELGGYVSSRCAAAWIRREQHYKWVATGPGRWRGGKLHRTAVARPGPIASGGCPASYAVTVLRPVP